MKVRYAKDQRVKAEIFPFHLFLSCFMAVGVFTTIQMKIIGEYIDYTKIAPSHAIAIPALWLALVQRIVELSDGTITVKSVSGKGSVFTVTLPAARKQEDRS